MRNRNKFFIEQGSNIGKVRFGIYLLLFLLLSLLGTSFGLAQTISKDELVFLTSKWDGERFSDGRPKISDDLVERAKNISIDDAWTVLRNEGYTNQFEGSWKTVKKDVPIVGRALTAMYMPSRPDIEENIKNRGINSQDRKGDTNSWPIDELSKGDVYVADGFGKIGGGTLVGATLSTSIYEKSGNGVIFNGSLRDLEEVEEIDGFNAFVRDFHPSFLESMVLMGLNTPIRIGNAIVLPGDLVIAKREGVLFIPAHMVERVISTVEFVSVKDEFGFEMIKNNRYSTGEIDSEWDDQLKTDFLNWLQEHPEHGTMTRSELEELLRERTW